MPPYSLRSEAVPTAGCNPDKYRSIGVTPEMGPQYQGHRPASAQRVRDFYRRDG